MVMSRLKINLPINILKPLIPGQNAYYRPRLKKFGLRFIIKSKVDSSIAIFIVVIILDGISFFKYIDK